MWAWDRHVDVRVWEGCEGLWGRAWLGWVCQHRAGSGQPLGLTLLCSRSGRLSFCIRAPEPKGQGTLGDSWTHGPLGMGEASASKAPESGLTL